jgi:hypothetical protein
MLRWKELNDSPYQTPSAAAVGSRRRSRPELEKIAFAQKGAWLSALAYVAVMIALWHLILRMGVVLVYVMLLVLIANAAFLSLLAMRVYASRVPIVLGLLMVAPLLGFIALIVVSGKANRIFREHGYPAGLLGPPLSALR